MFTQLFLAAVISATPLKDTIIQDIAFKDTVVREIFFKDTVLSKVVYKDFKSGDSKFLFDTLIVTTCDLPEVECNSEIIEGELRKYLELQERQNPAVDTCFWNLQIMKYDALNAYFLYLFRDICYKPDPGIAFMQYGKDVIIISAHVPKEFFSLKKENAKTVIMESNKMPFQCLVPSLQFTFDDRGVYQTKTVNDTARKTDFKARRRKMQ